MNSSSKDSSRNLESSLCTRGVHTSNPFSPNGFTLLELIVVVTVLGILSSITLPRIGNIISSSKIDEAKALLNTAAADCLQKSRLNEADKDQIDDAIVSDARVNPIGFKIDKNNNADKCSYFQLLPMDEDDNIRFPIGFSVSDGTLSKFATPTSTNRGSISSCERWAGVNCKQDESLKRLINWKKDIAASKASCETNYTNWLTVNNTTPYKFQRWNPNAEEGCPSRPPRDGLDTYQSDPTCTPNGCNREVYGLDGEFVGFTKEAYDQALEDKYGKLCTEWVASQKSQNITNNLKTQLPLTKTPECGNQEFWFFEGEDQGTKEKMLEKACDAWIETKAKQNPPYTNSPTDQPQTTIECGDQEFWFFKGENQGSYAELQTAQCESEIEDLRRSGWSGIWSANEGPVACSKKTYICSKKIVDESQYYQTCGALPPEQCKKPIGRFDQECADYETNEHKILVCGVRPGYTANYKDYGYPDPYPCGGVGRGAPTSIGWDKTDVCRDWAKKCDLYE